MGAAGGGGHHCVATAQTLQRECKRESDPAALTASQKNRTGERSTCLRILIGARVSENNQQTAQDTTQKYTTEYTEN